MVRKTLRPVSILFATALVVTLLIHGSAAGACTLEPGTEFDLPLVQVVRATKNIVVIKPISSSPQWQFDFWNDSKYFRWTFQVLKTLKGNAPSSSIEIRDVTPLSKNDSSFSARATVSPSCDFVIEGFRPNDEYIYFVDSRTFVNYRSAIDRQGAWLKEVEAAIAAEK